MCNCTDMTRSHRLEIRISTDEKKQLESQAKKAKLSMSQYVRQLIRNVRTESTTVRTNKASVRTKEAPTVRTIEPDVRTDGPVSSYFHNKPRQ